MPRCQALSADWLCPIKWHDIIFAGSLWLSPSFWLCFLGSCKDELTPLSWSRETRNTNKQGGDPSPSELWWHEKYFF